MFAIWLSYIARKLHWVTSSYGFLPWTRSVPRGRSSRGDPRWMFRSGCTIFSLRRETMIVFSGAEWLGKLSVSNGFDWCMTFWTSPWFGSIHHSDPWPADGQASFDRWTRPLPRVIGDPRAAVERRVRLRKTGTPTRSISHRVVGLT